MRNEKELIDMLKKLKMNWIERPISYEVAGAFLP